MTRKEFVEHIQKEITEEYESIGNYMKMAEAMPKFRANFTAIANDEQKHHDILVKMLAEMACEPEVGAEK